MKAVDAITVAMAAIEASTRKVPVEDVKTALRVLRATRRGELEKDQSEALARLTS
jgi:hypothetical protein